ncbi:MAG: outer membrane protein assembly factor [Deltaproteobacteria bacterium]|nr:outer membrane protein assembly factor [Deltaproteobacteria bacterium]
MMLFPVPHNLSALNRTWVVLILIGVLWPLKSMAAQTRGSVPYVVDIRGAPMEPPDVLRLLREVSQSVQKKDDPPPSMALLKRRAEGDLPEMQKVLRSFGFFRGKVSVDIISPEPGHVPNPDNVQGQPDAGPPPVKPVTVRFEIDPGPRFRFSQPSVSLAKDAPSGTLAPPTPGEAGIPDNAPYAARKVVEAGKFILNHYKNNGYPFPKIAHRDVVADFATNRVEVRFQVAPGPRALFGDIRVEGLERLDPEYVYELLPWKAGEPYDIRRIDKARKVLFGTNLFGMVEFDNPAKVDNHDRLPITVRLKERTRRTIRLGLEYTTDYGPGVSGSWTHRNLFGMAEKLTASAIFNSKIRTASLRFDKPMFMDRDNIFIAESAFNDETTDAYDARSMDVSTLLQRQFSRTFRAGGGVGFRYGRVKQKSNGQYSTYQLCYLPLTATQDTREDLLNPNRGYALSLAMAPYQDVVNGDTRFFRYLLSGSTYYNFNTGDKVVLAVRAAFGQVFGISHDEMPADLRFYAGGGGSVRGYAYQLAGPLQGDVPLGGLSVLTFSLELRFRITDTIGVVPFLDGGTAFLDRVPDFGSQDILYGAGLGLRYYTAIGPIRLDVAVPVNRRKGVDDSFQFYVSIGQSF